MPVCRRLTEALAAGLAALALLAGGPADAAAPAEVAALRDQLDGASRAGRQAEVQALLTRLLEAERSARAMNDLGVFHSDQGDFERAHALLTQAVAAASADQRGLYRANLALNLRRQFRDAEAERELNETLAAIDAYAGPTTGWRRCNLARSRTVALIQLSRLAERQGRLERALQLARAAQASATDALQQMPATASALERRFVGADLANSWRREVHVHIQAQAAADGERALAQWQAVAQQQALGGLVEAQVHGAAAALALSQRLFARAEQRALKADEDYARQGLAPRHLARVTVLESRIAALWAQGRAAEALALLARVDADAAGDTAAVEVVRLPLVRGLVLLDAGRADEAAAAFEIHRRQMAASAGAASLVHAEAQGLLGLALRASARPDERQRGAELLAQSVAVQSAPEHAGAPDGSGLRPLVRRRIVDAWLDSQLDTAGQPPIQAVALLDWLADNPVQRAVTQAAARMAIADPAMRDLVRQEQDLRREIDALTAPGGDEARVAAASSSAAPRLEALTRQLSQTLDRIRVAFPDYAALTQPQLPTPDRITRALAPDQALLVLNSRPQDTLVWLLRPDGRALGRRVALTRDQTRILVERLRTSLEFSEQGRLPPFDGAASDALHRLLIQPLLPELDGMRQLTVVTSGPLAALPLAVLAPAEGRSNRETDWLARRFALSHAPSVSGWLAARQLPLPASDRIALMAWGDPSFGPAAPRPADTAQRSSFRAARALRNDPTLPDPATAFPSLPDTRDELLAIARALGADPERSLHLGARATRASVLEASRSGRLAAAQVIALATHGLKAGEWPGLEQPALVMAMPADVPGVDPTEHMLRLDDTLGLKLHADWVVLSACNTTASDQETGEALSGLARGMFYAGARSLLATHWAVESRSATRLVSETFAAYASPARPGKAQALQQAMLAVMQTPATSHPAYWAPYVLIGDGGR